MAHMQAEKHGGAVGVSELSLATRLSRSTVRRRLNALIKGKLVHKPKRGKYYIARNDGSMSVGFCVNTTIDHIAYENYDLELGLG